MSHQPRYLAYCRSQGNAPDRQLEVDREAWPGGVMCGYMLWIRKRWCEWKKLKDYGPNWILSDTDHAEFDGWLNSDEDARQAA